LPTKASSFFNEIDQSKLAVDAGIKLRPSVLLIFGNPPLGTQFITRRDQFKIIERHRLDHFKRTGKIGTARHDSRCVSIQEPIGISVQ